ncbi:alpha/beta hydrolase [Luteolibacter ambystomatis]|uniref:Alpha/beta hydrolase n=1 Tax=Luteolibacter ambystomatis TaxID=2824561 RepID=A0A975G5Y7_9BACT|nr:alpha/beta hydrolase [Luteolibacter ambystomatis]QUE49417.1 alpha/beta hydrolase [Luteolibacter ambystomatis]
MFRDEAVSPFGGLNSTAFTHLRDLDYAGHGNPAQTLDLLLPPRGDGPPHPVVIYIHGGSWDSGEKEDGLVPLSLLASGDFALVSINYRLTGEARWPAPLEDARAALAFLRENAATWHLDPERIGIVGVSAGGQIAGMLGTHAPGTTAPDGIRCVASFFGPTDFLSLVGHPESLEPEEAAFAERFFGIAGPDLLETARRASPVNWVGPDAAPFLLIHGTEDEVVPFSQSEGMHAALLHAGVESTMIPVAGAGHGFFVPALLEPVRQFLGRHLLDRADALPRRRAG